MDELSYLLEGKSIFAWRVKKSEETNTETAYRRIAEVFRALDKLDD